MAASELGREEPGALPAGGDLELARRRFRSLQRHLDRRHHLYGRRHLLRRWHYEPLWPYATAWAAAVALGGADHLLAGGPASAWTGGLGRYEQPTGGETSDEGPLGLESRVVAPLGPGGERYYDDNTWIALAACRQYRLSGEPALLVLARRLFAFVVSGWSTEAHWAHPGGIRWKEPQSGRARNTCVNGPAAELAVELASLVGDERHLEWAERIYAWARAALLTSPGLYADRIAPDGTLDSTIWSYNQGTMVGAGVLLAAATGESRYLEEARRTAHASTSRYGNGHELDRQPPPFNAVYFRNLFLLDEVAPDPSYRELARAWVARLAAGRREPGTGNAGPVMSEAPLVEVAALLAGAPARP